jgi:hypothetical protein
MIDTFNIPAKGGVTVKQAQASLDKAKAQFGDARYGVVRTEKTGGVVNITYGPSGRASLLDADALAFELNN